MTLVDTLGHDRLIRYGVALATKIDKIIGLCCKIALQQRQYSAKKTYNLIDPTDRSHPIALSHERLRVT